MTLSLAGCSDVTDTGTTPRTRADLIALSRNGTAPPVMNASFFVSNSSPSVRTLRHDDAFNTLFAQISFPTASIERTGTGAVGTDDSVFVIITEVAGEFGIVVSPSELVFSNGSLPTITFAAAVYGIFDVADVSDRYPTPQSYLEELKVWQETSLDSWTILATSANLNQQQFSAQVARGGTFLVAAPR